jgi:hypothetical protein
MSANLIPLNKKRGGVRPIAIGEAYRRLVSKVANFSVRKEAIEYFGTIQLGVGRSNGAEAIVHAATYIFNALEESDTVLFKVDLSNAFNNVDRNTVLQQTLAVFPSLAHWVQYSYGESPYLFLGSQEIIRSSVGVQQGDPLGPLLFCLALQPLLLHLQNSCPTLSLNTWYMDDGILIGSPQEVGLAINLLSSFGKSYGVFVNEEKCELFPFSSQYDSTPFPKLISISTTGVELLGSYIGPSEFANAYVSKKVSVIEELLSLLPLLENLQEQYLLMKNCILLPKFMFLLRTFYPETIESSIQAFDNLIAKSISTILGSSPVDPFHYDRITLPIALSGAGILQANNTKYAAFWGSLLQSLKLQASLLKVEENMLTSVLTPNLYQYLSSINSTLTFETLLASKNPQKLITKDIYLYKYNDLLNNAPSPRDQYLLKAAALENSGEWLNILPTQTFRMSSNLWSLAFKYRFGIAIFNSEKSCPCCSGVLDIWGDHSVSCPGSFIAGSSAPRIARHESVKYTLLNEAKAGKIYCKTETPHLLTNWTKAKPGDIFFPFFIGGNDLCVDITIVNSLPEVSSSGSFIPAQLLQKAANSKHEKYNNECDKNGLLFQPFVMGSLGGWGEEAKKLIDKIAEAQLQNGTSLYTINQLAYFIRQKLSFVVQKQQSISFLERDIVS